MLISLNQNLEQNLKDLIYSNTNEGLQEFLSDSFQKAIDRYLDCFNKCRNKKSERSVHDLRVSIRRLRVVLDILDSIVESNYISVSKKLLKRQFKGLSRLRDVQVMIIKVRNIIEEYPILAGFYDYLMLNEKKLLKRLSAIINDDDYSDTKGVFAFLKLELTDKILESGFCFDILTKKTDELFSQLHSTANRIIIKDIETIHQTRIAFKKFRYIYEFQMPAYKEYSFDSKQFADYQTKMGVLQDLSVFIEELIIYINITSSIKEHISVLSYCFEEEKELLSEYISSKDDYQKFWEIQNKVIILD